MGSALLGARSTAARRARWRSAPTVASSVPRRARAAHRYPDDDQERTGRLLLLGKGAVLAHRLARPLAAESDDEEQPARHGSALAADLSRSAELESERGAAPFASLR
jgi:hypothetical protein